MKSLKLALGISLSILAVPSLALAAAPEYKPLTPMVDASVEATNPDGQGEKEQQIKSLLRKAISLHNEGNTAECQRVFEQVLTLDPSNVDANYNLGAIAEQNHDLQGALRYYGAALRSNPDDPDVRDAVSSVKRQLREAQTSASAADDMAQKQRLRQLGEQAALAYKSGRFDEAISALQEVVQAQPNDANVLFALGQAYRGKGDKQRAREYLSRAVALSPDNKLYQEALRESRQASSSQQAPPVSADNSAQPDETPPAAPDYRQKKADASGWVEDGDQSGADASGIHPFTRKGEAQLSNSNQGGLDVRDLQLGGGFGGLGVGGLGSSMGSGTGMGTGPTSGSRLGRIVRMLGGGLGFGSGMGMGMGMGIGPGITVMGPGMTMMGSGVTMMSPGMYYGGYPQMYGGGYPGGFYGGYPGSYGSFGGLGGLGGIGGFGGLGGFGGMAPAPAYYGSTFGGGGLGGMAPMGGGSFGPMRR